jgi:flagellar hook-associated protein 3 FlgL
MRGKKGEGRTMRVDPHYITGLVAALNGTSALEQRLTGEVSSGVRLTAISDDPAAAGQNVSLTAALSRDDAFATTASSAESKMQVTDTALGAVVDQLTQALSVATAGNNGTSNPANLKSVSLQLTGIRDEVLSLANTSYGGSYLFSGSKTDTQPFTLDSSTTPATVTYAGDTRGQFIETPGGQKIQTNLPGAQVFTAPGADLLGTLNTLIASFASGDTATAQSATTQLSSALNQVSSQRVSLDNAINRTQAATSYNQAERTQLLTTQTNLMQADLPGIATSMSSAETQRSALESLIAAVEKQGTLFDYLH